ncbi:MAG: response regulator, partial [Rikenellaceae bacterium]
MKLKCVAIDDEPLALRQIDSYIKRVDILEHVNSWSDSRRALDALKGESEQMLVFVDIDMPDIDGLELVNQLENRHYIIFTTAYSEYAIDGFRLNAVDYLLKPFSFAEFERAVNKVYKLHKLESGST